MLGELIRDMRVQHKLTQADLSLQIGVDRTMISKYEKGSSIPSLDVLVNISRVFSVPLEYFLANEKKTTHIEQSLNDEQQRLAALAKSLSDDELNDVIDYVNFVKSKRN